MQHHAKRLAKRRISNFRLIKLLGLILLFPYCTAAQTFPVDAVTGKIYFAEEVLVKDGPQLDLYNRAKAWFAAPENKAMLQKDDLANGLLIGQKSVVFTVKEGSNVHNMRLNCTLKLEMEDDRYWYSLTDFYIQKWLKQAAGGGKIPNNNLPLEKMVIPENRPVTEYSRAAYYKAVENATYKQIRSSIECLKASML